MEGVPARAPPWGDATPWDATPFDTPPRGGRMPAGDTDCAIPAACAVDRRFRVYVPGWRGRVP